MWSLRKIDKRKFIVVKRKILRKIYRSVKDINIYERSIRSNILEYIRDVKKQKTTMGETCMAQC